MGRYYRHWLLLAGIIMGALTTTCQTVISLPAAITPMASPDTSPPVAPGQSAISLLAPMTAVTIASPTVDLRNSEARSITVTIAPRQKLNLDDIAPPGRARDLVLQNCGTCHSFICPFRGQRTIDHWQTIKQDMREKVSSLADQDYDVLFAYLEENFNDHKPEPNLPSDFQQLGCDTGVR